ncbi:WG repeat-containing protein [Streptomyces durbertensis]|uniref:WG repeat-containing protein n=1 Tax=Streptomyces durbertensis TaxID=2448886 RepID=A0ABR6ELB3_9ACTN|nr:WG repeat-containing protein [Streptomyces durbertensis]MBB1246136.1 WG repeat-containing protein [Streptomyces durbertensis]
MTDIVSRWREFEETLGKNGFGWALEYAPADLRWARTASHPHGARLDHLLPADYRTFVQEVGYPVLGFRSYDRRGTTFLPPEAMAVLSVEIYDEEHGFPDPVDGAPTRCRHAFFAGYDLSDLGGYSLAADGVWVVENAVAVEHVGTFTEWLLGELADVERRVAEPGFLAETDPDGAADPHRLLDYSLEPDLSRPPYSVADLELRWVEDQADHPYSYGLIDGEGRWRVPMGRRYEEVRPFRDGVAEVRLPVEDGSSGGPWTRIDTGGRPVDQPPSR